MLPRTNTKTAWLCFLLVGISGACSSHRIDSAPRPADPPGPGQVAEDPAPADPVAASLTAADQTTADPAASDPLPTGQPDPAADPADLFVSPAELPDDEVDRRISRLDSLLLIPVNAYDIHDKGRNHIRTFTRALQKTLLTPGQTERVAGYMDDLLERHPEATRMITRQQFLVEHLTPGKAAPEIVGKDLDGVEFELAEYRGNIVVLFFTGEWCAPCHAEYPHQRKMLELYQGKNVVLLGVNSDDELERVLEAKEREGLHYRTWWDEATRGPIAQSWIVWSWPTTYILDASGVIRYVDLRGDAIMKAVDELLAEGTRLIGGR